MQSSTHSSAMDIPRRVIASVAFGGCMLTVLAFAPHAAAAAGGWSRTPGSALPGGSVHVASSPSALCQWLQPGEPPPSTTSTSTASVSDPAPGASETAIDATATGDPIVFDGVRVELRLESAGIAVPLGSVRVIAGGAWSGTVPIPEASAITPGDYELLARCIVDDPALDGIRSFDFDPLPFTIVDAPPPTTVTIPTEIGEPVTVTKPAVEGTRLERPAANVPNPGAPVRTLPNTGDGTLGVALAGFGSLVLGAGALWWGSRRVPTLP